MSSPHFEFVPGDEKIVAPGIVAKRIRALVAIPALLWAASVQPGELGGYIAVSKNLVSGNAWVYGDALVYGDAQVSGNARVSGNAQVSGDARVEKQSDWLLVGPAKSSGRFTTAYQDAKIGVRVSCGCFGGTLAEFSAAIEGTHANNETNLGQYRLFCQLIAFNFDVQS